MRTSRRVTRVSGSFLKRALRMWLLLVVQHGVCIVVLPKAKCHIQNLEDSDEDD